MARSLEVRVQFFSVNRRVDVGEVSSCGFRLVDQARANKNNIYVLPPYFDYPSYVYPTITFVHY